MGECLDIYDIRSLNIITYFCGALEILRIITGPQPFRIRGGGGIQDQKRAKNNSLLPKFNRVITSTE